MAGFVSIFISARWRRLIAGLVWLAVFAVVLAAAGGYALHKAANVAQAETQRAVEQFGRLRANLFSAFDMMHAELTAEPCSPAFRERLRRIAYLPDGLNEFLYAPGGKAQCSTSVEAFERPVDFGKPDMIEAGQRGVALWIDRDLGFLGLSGEKGSFALSEPFAVVVPPQKADLRAPPWLSMELVLRASDGRWFHRDGEEGVYDRRKAASGLAALSAGRVDAMSCDAGGVHCVAAEARLAALVDSARGEIALALLAAAAIAAYASSRAARLISRFWSFEARFRRHLDATSLVCAYQPVMHLESGEIAGCEVLARWRDLDDRIVFPDRFIDIVKRHGLTMHLTKLVADRACEELSAAIPPGRRLQVSFNIFPQDIDSPGLKRVFAGFIAQPDRFDVVLEIVESDEMPANAQREIEALRRAGIKIYIDDFGAGYSNMQNLAGLSVDGVKLDRAFAMAPDNSMMAQMLRHAVEMIEAAGRVMVVEGVETAERLALLRRMRARIDFVQGYFIARPLDIAGFAAFLSDKATPDAEEEIAALVRGYARDRIQRRKIAV